MSLKELESLEDIKKFFRQQVKRLHPDLGGDKESFLEFLKWYKGIINFHLKKIDKAQVKIVKTPVLKGKYIFSSLELTVEEIALGGKRKIEIPGEEKICVACEGTGYNLTGNTLDCGFCKGKGIISTIEQRKEKEVFLSCPYCRGKGKIYTEKCNVCRGKGKLREKKEVIIEIPLGLKEGDYIWISKDVSHLDYDLYLEIVLKKHPYFYIKENNLIYKCVIPFWEIILRDYVKVKTLEGEEEISSSLFREGKPIILKNRGPFLENGKRGDLIVEYSIYFPDKIPEKVKSLIEEAIKILTNP